MIRYLGLLQRLMLLRPSNDTRADLRGSIQQRFRLAIRWCYRREPTRWRDETRRRAAPVSASRAFRQRGFLRGPHVGKRRNASVTGLRGLRAIEAGYKTSSR